MSNVEDLKRILKEKGIDLDSPSWTHGGNRDLSGLPVLQKQRELLVSIRKVLQAQLEKDQRDLEHNLDEREKIVRGGGS
jgi:hypothetical protein